MKLDEDKGDGNRGQKAMKRDLSDMSQISAKIQNGQTPLSSTTKSLDLPPKEYELLLQQYEGEVRNHIKVEQQLKLHIEVMQDKMDDLEKDKVSIVQSFEKHKREFEQQIRKQYDKALNQKDSEIDTLADEVKKTKETIEIQILMIENYKQSQARMATAGGAQQSHIG